MRMKSILAAAAALSLAASPSIATAQTAAPAELAPQAEQVEGSEIRGGFILPLLALAALAYAVLELTKDDEPASP